MKLSKPTIELLKNFASINQSILFKAGTKQVTKSPGGTILANVEIDEDISKPFAIYDLNQFIGILSLFEDPEIEIETNYAKITTDKQVVKYRFCDPKLVVSPTKEYTLPSIDVSLELTKEILTKIQNAVGMLKTEHIAFVGDGVNITLKTHSTEDVNASSASFIVGDTKENFTVIFKYDSLKLMPGEYLIEISKNKLTKWTNKDKKIHYFIPSSKESKFE